MAYMGVLGATDCYNDEDPDTGNTILMCCADVLDPDTNQTVKQCVQTDPSLAPHDATIHDPITDYGNKMAPAPALAAGSLSFPTLLMIGMGGPRVSK